MYKRKFVPKRTFKGRKPAKQLTKRVARIEKGIETKAINFFQPNTNIGNTTATYSLTCYNGMLRGVARTQRIGNKIMMKAFRINLLMLNEVLTGTSSCRSILFYDRRPNGAAWTITNLLASAGAGEHYLSPYAFEHRKRFKILHDKVYDLANGGGSTNQSIAKCVTIDLKWPAGLPTMYNDGNAGTNADIDQGALFHLLVSSQALGTGTTIAHGSLLEFEDV